MDSIKSFFGQIDGRILEFNLRNLTNTDNSNYLFDPKPATFHMQSWAFVVGFLGIVSMVLFLIFLKRRRNILQIEKGKRHILNFHSKINLVFFVVYFFFVFMRSQGVMYMSMRFFEWICLFFVVLSSLAAVVRVIRYKPESVLEADVKTDDMYLKYLPKKKRK